MQATELLFLILLVSQSISASMIFTPKIILGFGKSDKYTNPENYTHEMHCFVLRKLMDHLNISKMTLVCQDWGGLIGLTTVKDVPHMFFFGS